MTLDLDHTARLPPELIHRILDGFSFEELQPVLAVCARWRQIALNDPAYWSFITLTSCTTAAASLFLARLARSGTRSVALYVHVFDAPGGLPPSIYSALRDHLHRVTFLDITVPVALVATVLGYLTVEAPILGYLRLLGLCPENEAHLPIMPTNLFGCRSPALTKISIQNVVLPQSAVVPALSNVTDICVSFRPWSVPVPDLFRQCPATVIIEFCDPIFSPESAYHDSASWGSVWRCTFNFERMHDACFLPFAAVARLPEIHIVQPYPHDIENLVRQLAPPYHLKCRHKPKDPTYDCRLIFMQRDWLRQREVVDNWDALVDRTHQLCLVFCSSIIRDVISLDIPASWWGPLVNLLPRMETLQTLHLCITDGDDVSTLAASGTIRCPALEFMGIISLDGPQFLSADDAVAFVRLAIAEAAMGCVVLYLQNVQLVGPTDHLQEHFVHLAPLQSGISL